MDTTPPATQTPPTTPTTPAAPAAPAAPAVPAVPAAPATPTAPAVRIIRDWLNRRALFFKIIANLRETEHGTGHGLSSP